MKAREQRTEVTADRVLEEIAKIAYFDIRRLYRPDGSLKSVHELDDVAAAVLAGVETIEAGAVAKPRAKGASAGVSILTKKVKIADKVAALTLLARHLKLLTDKIEHSGNGPMVLYYSGHNPGDGTDPPSIPQPGAQGIPLGANVIHIDAVDEKL
jgi:phage terminase small subunit